MTGEPCRIVCQSDPSVQCSSYAGDCQGLSDQVICDGQAFQCPGTDASDASDASDAIDASDAPKQPALQDQAAKPDQAGQPCEARDDRGQDRQLDRRHGRDHGRHEGHHQGCDQGCRQWLANAEVPCSGANAAP
jgi:hypothetical protein